MSNYEGHTPGPLEIVFDGPPSHESGRFVEAEINGASVNCGEWVERRDGYWSLQIFQDVAAPTLLAQRDALAEIGWRILGKLESPTESVTSLDARDLRCALSSLDENQ